MGREMKEGMSEGKEKPNKETPPRRGLKNLKIFCRFIISSE